ncbi:Transcriptional regulator, TetR family [Pseudonocardia sp. Ae168_Ps1]|uniref:TetR/AcrR family transcriptional regulator n=1 Tax=unclassified Pseudonocardia TaxID=2619320 RepID=UPI0006CAFA3B|nr:MULTISPECIES: TetR/AcrR family transcriptional regulator [unclassified Pseudonocardia]ALE73109.1 TetR family transcriptional regulator [Pseudonocardia sp. EC080625-04]ALL76429.1 TetR family transcriptional regulator [Pseudonocardia sp. EC080610-09]ALL83456.1 TetR family transcriptional regulator [Pseudonocardia sp. EC080619-01]OLL72724.1 Transcriptional regulator, TetR family [Pseudonocardia sp. Ae150A_Ps1]OLL78695.1 Transcriptional regulator, TetR family [Pseudonocardia sp. Ae168_Ps1]
MTTERTHGTRTRAQRSEDSRARILDAAVACLIDGGYSGATTLTIQSAADVSRGRLLHHFPSRDRLLVAAAQHLAVKRVADTEERVRRVVEENPPADAFDRADRVIELLWESFSEPHFWASIELWTAARANGEIADALRPEERRLGAAIRASMARMFGDELASRPRFKQVRDLLLTSMRGAAMTYTFDPRDPRDDSMLAQWKDLVRALLAG